MDMLEMELVFLYYVHWMTVNLLQVLALDKRYLDPRRSVNPTQAEREEGIIPLTDSLPIIPQVGWLYIIIINILSLLLWLLLYIKVIVGNSTTVISEESIKSWLRYWFCLHYYVGIPQVFNNKMKFCKLLCSYHFHLIIL